MMLKILYGNIFIILFVLSACYQPPKPEVEKANKEYREALIRVNKCLIKKDVELIERYVERRGWEMDRTPTGLWIMKYHKGEGRKVEKGKTVTISYTLELLDGTLCYRSDSLRPKSFRVGKGNVEAGLEEGILRLNVGDKARLIMPPHLAHGLIGDQNKIPSRSTLVYNLSVLSISEAM